MYRNDSHTPRFLEFGLPFGGCLDPENRWINKAALIPWSLVEKEYLNQLSGSTNGSPAVKARLAFGAILIKEELQLSDRETVEQIRENPYLQFFVGLEGFQTEAPFDASLMVAFRKRFPLESMNRINEAMVLAAMKPEQKKPSDQEESLANDSKNVSKDSSLEANKTEEAKPENQGKLIVDATWTPADIRYPTDLSLLNEAREKTEEIIDILYGNQPGNSPKPRTYRKKARQDYLAVAKKKKRSYKLIRQAIRKQLGYLNRNLGYIQTLLETVSLGVLKWSLHRALRVIHELYRQQKIMYATRTKRIDDRIVSIWFPHVRPIKRGKANADTEFGAKLHVSMVQGFVFVERIDWNHFNEGTDLIPTMENYRRRFGYYPESVHADKIYRHRKNLDYCKKNGIRLSGPTLGRPPKNTIILEEQKQLARQDEIDRIPIEGKFGQGKRRYGLARIMAKLPETSTTVISLSLFVMNLHKIFTLCNLKGSFLPVLLWIWRVMKAVQTRSRAVYAKSPRFYGHSPLLYGNRYTPARFTERRPYDFEWNKTLSASPIYFISIHDGKR